MVTEPNQVSDTTLSEEIIETLRIISFIDCDS